MNSLLTFTKMSELQLIKHIHFLCFLVLLVMLLLNQATPCSAYNFRDTNGTKGTIRCLDKERKALLENFPNCIQPISISDNCCNWYGVYCNNFTGRIYMLDIDDDFFQQFEFTAENCEYFSYINFHPSLLSLEDLLYLTINTPYNLSFDRISSFIGSFPKLRSLAFISYYGSGEIHPKLGNLTNLQSLEMIYYYYGEFPPRIRNFEWLSHLTSLKRLVLQGIDMSKASDLIPAINNLSSLRHLDLRYSHVATFLSSHVSSTNFSKSLAFVDLSETQLKSSFIWTWLFNHSSSLVKLYLSNNELTGQIPYSFRNMTSLSHLVISGNNITGDISSIFNSLSFAKPWNLEILNLGHNQLTGSIPDLSVYRSLQVLQLQNNRLNGTIHLNIGLLTSLKIFDISSNFLKDSIYADHFSNLSNLQHLDMSFNSLTINISSDWVPPFRLSTIGLASCMLGSRFPLWLQTQRNYSRLDMSNVGISDTVPFWFWNLSSVATFIGLSRNSLYGTIPDSSIEFYGSLAIDLSSNLLEGRIPSFMSNVDYLNLSRNSFSGSISFLCQNVTYKGQLFGLDISHNLLSGKLPNCWNDRYILVLDLSSNKFFGNIPSSFGSLRSLGIIHLRDNLFSGKLPLSLTNFTDLLSLDVGDNLFYGEIPTFTGQMQPKLTALSLRNNRFSGMIPLQLCNLSSIQILDLSKNNISGSIPHCLCNLTSMTGKKTRPMISPDSNNTFASIGKTYQDYISLALKGSLYEFTKHLELVKSIDLSSNRLGGEIPSEISCLSGLISLNLSRNNLSGYITPKIGQFKSLESLDLSDNHLSGQIPATLSELNFLGTLSLANNNLSGRIPSGTQIQGFNASVFAGNQRLCGDPLPNKCAGYIERGNNSNQDHQNLKHEDGVVSLGLYISIVLGFITGFWVVCGVLVLNKSPRYAYFPFWDHTYARIHGIIALKVALIRRQFQT